MIDAATINYLSHTFILADCLYLVHIKLPILDQGERNPGGGTLKFSVYIGRLLWGQNFEFPYFFGFSEKLVIFRVVSFLWIIFGGHAFSELFFWGHL